MIATNKDGAIHIPYRSNNEIGGIYGHNIAKKDNSMIVAAKYWCDRIRDIVVEQEVQPRCPDTSVSWLCVLVPVRVKLP